MDDDLYAKYLKQSILGDKSKGLSFDWDDPDKYYTSGAGPTQYNADHNFAVDGTSLLKPTADGGIMSGLSSWAERNKFGIGLVGGIADLGMGIARFGLQKDYFKHQMAGIDADIAAKRQRITSRNAIQSAFSGPSSVKV